MALTRRPVNTETARRVNGFLTAVNSQISSYRLKMCPDTFICTEGRQWGWFQNFIFTSSYSGPMDYAPREIPPVADVTRQAQLRNPAMARAPRGSSLSWFHTSSTRDHPSRPSRSERRPAIPTNLLATREYVHRAQTSLQVASPSPTDTARNCAMQDGRCGWELARILRSLHQQSSQRPREAGRNHGRITTRRSKCGSHDGRWWPRDWLGCTATDGA